MKIQQNTSSDVLKGSVNSTFQLLHYCQFRLYIYDFYIPQIIAYSDSTDHTFRKPSILSACNMDLNTRNHSLIVYIISHSHYAFSVKCQQSGCGFGGTHTHTHIS